MKCSKCGKPLTDPESQSRGFGPICWGKVMADREVAQNEHMGLIPGFNGDVICKREGGKVYTNIPRVITRHSPDGFEWGYGGSGPADFALNIMAAFLGTDRAQRNSLYQEFKAKFVATLPEEGGTIKRADIESWLESKGMKSILPPDKKKTA